MQIPANVVHASPIVSWEAAVNVELGPINSTRHGHGPESLANLPPFAVGPLSVEPALRNIRGPNGREAVIEPLVMQVLIALAGAYPAPSSRDDLVAACWNRRIVGDDAVNRVISNLRRQLAFVAGDGVAIETIAKVGYRLKVPETHSAGSHDGTTPSAGSAGSRLSIPARWIMVSVTLAALGAVLGAAILRPQGNTSLTMTIEPSAIDASSPVLTGDLTAELAKLAGAMTGLIFLEPGQAAEPDLVLKVSHTAGDGLRQPLAQVRLIDQDNGAVVWSREFTGPTDAILRERAAHGIAGVIQCGLHRSSGDLRDPVSKRLYLAACDAVDQLDWPRALSLARQIVDRRPDSAATWACLALATANLAHEDQARRNILAKHAAAQARKALAIDRNSGLAHQAMAAAEELAGRPALPMLEEGVRRDPEHAGLLSRYSRALAELGYTRAAVDAAQRANALEPSSFFTAQVKLLALMAVGRFEDATHVDGYLQRVWNDSLNVGYTRHAMRFYASDPVAALRAFERDPPPNPMVASRQKLELKWRVAPGNFDWAAFDEMAADIFAERPEEAWYLAASAIRMGDRERAFAWLERAPPARRELAPIFWADTAALRREPRFFRKMVQIGLVDRWRERETWPDFCTEPGLSYDCESMAHRLRRKAGSGTV